MTVNICGILHNVIECKDMFDADNHFGQIDYNDCRIKVNKDLAKEFKNEIICHEMLHGILVHLGYNDFADNEQFVQAIANAINQGFIIRDMEDKI